MRRLLTEDPSKNCPLMGKTCNNCRKPNYLTKTRRSQQISEVIEDGNSSNDECNSIQNFDSSDEFEIMPIETNSQTLSQIEKYVQNRLANKKAIQKEKMGDLSIKNVYIRRSPQSETIKSRKALFRIDNQVINLTVNACSQVSFLNWATAKQIMELSKKASFVSTGSQACLHGMFIIIKSLL